MSDQAEITRIYISCSDLRILEQVQRDIIPLANLDAKAGRGIRESRTTAVSVAVLLVGKVVERLTAEQLLSLRGSGNVDDVAVKLLQSIERGKIHEQGFNDKN